MDVDRMERLRSKAVFRSVEKLIEDAENDCVRLVSQEGVWRASRCMSGEEFESSVEERSLVGVCGNPTCSNAVGDDEKSTRKKKKPYVCCSVFCYEAVEEMAGRLGSRKEALERFTALYESAKYQREKKEKERKELSRRVESGLAAGTKKAPVMQAVVQERSTTRRRGKKEHTNVESYDFESVEGYKPVNKSTKEQRRVRFSDENAAAEVDGKARFVFDIEDPKGHVDGDMTSLGDQFGTLRVVESHDEPEPDTVHDDREQQPVAAPVDEVLAKTMREGAAKYFPHLKSCIPSEFYDEDDDDEYSAGDDDDDDDWMQSDDDVDDDDIPIKCHTTFFTEIFSFFDLWITDYTIALLRSETRHIDSTLPQVPEILTAMQRFLSIACSTLAVKLCAQDHQRSMTDSVGQVVRTFRLDQALPAFQSKQWVIVALVIVKAQSLSSHPEYQQFTDTRDAISRIGSVLADANFTVEEFYAVLDLFLLLGEENTS